MSTPQLIISFSPQGELVTELPGLNGSRRKINLKINQKSNLAIAFATQVLREISQIGGEVIGITDATKASELLSSLQNKIKTAADAANQISHLLDEDNTLSDILIRILSGQQSSKHMIGEDGNPTEQQVKHWQKHSNIWGDPTCPFCIAEGKFEPGKNREDTRSLKGLTEFEALRLGLVSRGYSQSKNNPDIYSKKNMGNVILLPNGKIKDHKNVIWSEDARKALIQDGKIHAKTFGFKPLEVFKTKGCVVKKQKKMITETQAEKLARKIGTLSF